MLCCSLCNDPWVIDTACLAQTFICIMHSAFYSIGFHYFVFRLYFMKVLCSLWKKYYYYYYCCGDEMTARDHWVVFLPASTVCIQMLYSRCVGLHLPLYGSCSHVSDNLLLTDFHQAKRSKKLAILSAKLKIKILIFLYLHTTFSNYLY